MILGCKLAYLTEDYTYWKIIRFNYMCEIIKRAMIGKARLESQLIYRIMAVPTAICRNETRIMRKNHQTRIQTEEMKFLCRVTG